jgi:hypothetical protein
MNEDSIQSLGQISSSLFPAWVTRDDIQLSGNLNSIKTPRPRALRNRLLTFMLDSGKLIALAKFLAILKKANEEKIIVGT